MIDYQYAGTATDGKPCQGSIRAPSAEAARLRLIGQGITPVSLQGGDAAAAAMAAAKSEEVRLKRADILLFTRELSHLKSANMPLDRALVMLQEIANNDRLKAFVIRVTEGVRSGKSLYISLQPFERDLGRRYLVMIRAGEASGGLTQVLKELTGQLEADDKLRNYIISSMTYPIILAGVAVLSVVILLAFVVPQFQALFESMDAQLPWYSTAVLQVSLLVRGWWWALLLAGAGLAAWLYSRFNDPAARRALDARVLGWKFPGDLIAKLDTARLARTLGTLVRNGVPLLTALNLSRPVLSNSVLADAIEAAAEDVKTGSGLGYAMARQKCFPRLAVHMIQVGEESGELDAMLLKAADTFDQETANALDRLLAALVPALTVLMTLVVGAIMISVLLPIYDLTNSI